MPQDILFMLKPNLVENGRTYHCPDCTIIEGVLSYHPNVRHELEIHYLDFSRPRPPVIDLLGEENQGCPVIIVRRGDVPAGLPVKTANGHSFINDVRGIAKYLAHTYGSTFPH
jgi:hypothetical protein